MKQFFIKYFWDYCNNGYINCHSKLVVFRNLLVQLDEKNMPCLNAQEVLNLVTFNDCFVLKYFFTESLTLLVFEMQIIAERYKDLDWLTRL